MTEQEPPRSKSARSPHELGVVPEFTFALSDEEIELRKQWLNLHAEDEQLIKMELDALLRDHVDDLMDKMYAHFLSFEETRSFFPNQTILLRAKNAQGEYFRRLTQGDYSSDYVRERVRVGSTHHRIELDPKWYLGAYNHAFGLMLPRITEHFISDPEKLNKAISALQKIMFFDMGLAIESYIGTKEFYLRKHRDIMQELETEKRVTKSILESAPIGIVTLDADFTCLECNDEFIEFFQGEQRATVIGRNLFDIAPKLNRSMFEEVLESGHPCRRSADVLTFNGAPAGDIQYWDWAAWPIKDHSSAIRGLVATFSSVTDSVMLQQQREDFVATLTHDLKTPISATNRAVKFLLEGDFGPVSDGQREILETIHQSNKALYSLVQTLLDVYRFDSGVKELNMKMTNVAAIITHMVTELMPLAQEKGIELRASLPGDSKEVQCDDDEIRRVIQNLIDNSLKFTASGGTITVAMKQDGKTTITVTDTGKGVPEENKPKLFQRFWQAGSTGRYYASTGLGLYLCRRIVEAHGGRIWCESTLGKGSTFTFDF
jgi:PAS domain S-box-containing protein